MDDYSNLCQFYHHRVITYAGEDMRIIRVIYGNQLPVSNSVIAELMLLSGPARREDIYIYIY